MSDQVSYSGREVVRERENYLVEIIRLTSSFIFSSWRPFSPSPSNCPKDFPFICIFQLAGIVHAIGCDNRHQQECYTMSGLGEIVLKNLLGYLFSRMMQQMILSGPRNNFLKPISSLLALKLDKRKSILWPTLHKLFLKF